MSDPAPAAGAEFTLSATVRNAGDGRAAATTLRFYRSSDATITPSDAQVGAASVAGLTASGSVVASVSLSAPSSPRTYYYGACADAVAEESDTTNNCSASVRVTAPQPQAPPSEAEPPPQETLPEPARPVPRSEPRAAPSPDLVVESPSVSNANPVAGAGITLSATVRNAGDGRAAATTLRFYRSPDATITTSDAPVGDASVAELAASGSVVASVELSAPQTPGTHHYGACVVAVAEESDTANNCSASVRVTVSMPPDMAARAPDVPDTNPFAGRSFKIWTTARNVGGRRAGRTTMRVYRSDDATITRSDTQVRAYDMPRVQPSKNWVRGDWLTAPWTPGTYYYGICVDAVAGESNTANNCSASVRVEVRRRPPADSEHTARGQASVSARSTSSSGYGAKCPPTSLRSAIFQTSVAFVPPPNFAA